MDDLDHQLLMQNPGWQQLLQAYLDLTAEAAERPAEETGPRWADRIVSMNGIEPEELSSIHGRLIAQGWLKFQFEVGQSGLTYRVSSEGRRLLNRIAALPQADTLGEISNNTLPAEEEHTAQRAA